MDLVEEQCRDTRRVAFVEHLFRDLRYSFRSLIRQPMLLAASLLMGEEGVVAFTPLALASLAYQGVLVAFGSYLVWFWLLTRYLAARLSVFSFLTPLFGVLFGVLILREPLTPSFVGAALLVGAGIVLVNRR